jgi:hypothetical protein
VDRDEDLLRDRDSLLGVADHDPAAAVVVVLELELKLFEDAVYAAAAALREVLLHDPGERAGGALLT